VDLQTFKANDDPEKMLAQDKEGVRGEIDGILELANELQILHYGG